MEAPGHGLLTYIVTQYQRKEDCVTKAKSFCVGGKESARIIIFNTGPVQNITISRMTSDIMVHNTILMFQSKENTAMLADP